MYKNSQKKFTIDGKEMKGEERPLPIRALDS